MAVPPWFEPHVTHIIKQRLNTLQQHHMTDVLSTFLSSASFSLLSPPSPSPMFCDSSNNSCVCLVLESSSHNHSAAILCCFLQHFRTSYSNHSLGSPCKSSFRPGRSFHLETSITGFTGISIPAQRTLVNCVGLHNIKYLKVFWKNPCIYSFSALWHSHHCVLVQPGILKKPLYIQLFSITAQSSLCSSPTRYFEKTPIYTAFHHYGTVTTVF